MTCAEVVTFLQAHDNYLILTHKRPDGDAIGCSVALVEILRGMGKTAWLPNLSDATALFDEYLEGQMAPTDFVPETVVSVDLATLNLLPDHALAWKERIDLAIDHHPSNDGFAKQTWLEGDRAACGEIIYQIAEAVGVMNSVLANALYVAVSTDCGCFVYSNTTANTHRVAAELIASGADYKRLNKKHFRTKSMARMRLEGLILRDMSLYRNGTIAVAPVSLSMMAEAGAGEGDAEDIAALLGQIDGVRYSATIRELKPGECKISLRSGDAAFDASCACARLGGGGHRAAAGCVVHGTVEVAERAIVAAICAEFDD